MDIMFFSELSDSQMILKSELREARQQNELLTEAGKESLRIAERWKELYEVAAIELRETQKRVRELESEIQVRDNSANLVFDTLKAALPNRGFHSEMEAAEAAAKELAELREWKRKVMRSPIQGLDQRGWPISAQLVNAYLGSVLYVFGEVLETEPTEACLVSAVERLQERANETEARIDARDRRMKRLGAAAELQEWALDCAGTETGDLLMRRAAELEAAEEGEEANGSR